MKTATYVKLADGSWGLQGKDLMRGDHVHARTLDGRMRRETVHSVLTRGEDGLTVARKEYSGPQSGSWRRRR